MRSRLTRSRLTRSRLTRSRLIKSRLIRSRLIKSRLTQSRLMRSRLTQSQLMPIRIALSQLMPRPKGPEWPCARPLVGARIPSRRAGPGAQPPGCMPCAPPACAATRPETVDGREPGRKPLVPCQPSPGRHVLYSASPGSAHHGSDALARRAKTRRFPGRYESNVPWLRIRQPTDQVTKQSFAAGAPVWSYLGLAGECWHRRGYWPFA